LSLESLISLRPTKRTTRALVSLIALISLESPAAAARSCRALWPALSAIAAATAHSSRECRRNAFLRFDLRDSCDIAKSNCVIRVLGLSDSTESAALHVLVEVAHLSSGFSRLGFHRCQRRCRRHRGGFARTISERNDGDHSYDAGDPDDDDRDPGSGIARSRIGIDREGHLRIGRTRTLSHHRFDLAAVHVIDDDVIGVRDEPFHAMDFIDARLSQGNRDASINRVLEGIDYSLEFLSFKNRRELHGQHFDSSLARDRSILFYEQNEILSLLLNGSGDLIEVYGLVVVVRAQFGNSRAFAGQRQGRFSRRRLSPGKLEDGAWIGHQFRLMT